MCVCERWGDINGGGSGDGLVGALTEGINHEKIKMRVVQNLLII